MPTSAPAVSRRPLVLLVDDDHAARLVIVRALSTEGYDTLIAGSGEAATTMLRALRMPPDMIIADLRMGRGTSGFGEGHWPAVGAPGRRAESVVEQLERAGQLRRRPNPALRS